MIGSLMVKKVCRSGFAALNEGDLMAFLGKWSEDSVFIYPPIISVGGKIEGKKAIEGWFQRWMKQFPKRNFVLKNVCVERICSFGATNVVTAEWDVTVTNKEGEELTLGGVTVIDIKKGKAVRVIDYLLDTELLQKAWGEK